MALVLTDFGCYKQIVLPRGNQPSGTKAFNVLQSRSPELAAFFLETGLEVLHGPCIPAGFISFFSRMDLQELAVGFRCL